MSAGIFSIAMSHPHHRQVVYSVKAPPIKGPHTIPSCETIWLVRASYNLVEVKLTAKVDPRKKRPLLQRYRTRDDSDPAIDQS